MRKILFQLILGIIAVNAWASTNFEEGIAAYKDKDYTTAIQSFRMATQENDTDVSSYYNLGLSLYQMDSLGQAIWAFEKALKYAPNDSDAKQKAALSYETLYPGETWEAHLGGFKSAAFGVSPGTWSIIAIVLAVLLAAFIVLFVKSNNHSTKRLSIALAFFCLLGVIGTTIIARSATINIQEHTYGIITEEVIDTYTEANKVSDAKLTEGVRLYVVESDKEFTKVELASGDTYKIRTIDFEMI